MKNLLTGAAQSVTDTNERARKLFENRPMQAPAPSERQNRPRKTFAKAPVEDEAAEDEAPEAKAADDDRASEVDAPEADEGLSPEGDSEEE